MNELPNTIEGTVDSVVYQNPENGYTVLRLDVGEEELDTVVGCIPGVAPGETIAAQGSWTHHATYGQQFKAEVARRGMPVGEKAIFDYLASGVVKGVGLSTARKIVEEFGDRALEVLERAPEKLTAVKGVTKKRAEAIGEMGMRRLLEFLTAHDLPPQLGMPLYGRFGDRALEEIEANPYQLAEGELAIPFAQADKLALKLGFADEHPQRLEAGVAFTLQHNLDNGHTFLPRQKLLQAHGHVPVSPRDGKAFSIVKFRRRLNCGQRQPSVLVDDLEHARIIGLGGRENPAGQTEDREMFVFQFLTDLIEGQADPALPGRCRPGLNVVHHLFHRPVLLRFRFCFFLLFLMYPELIQFLPAGVVGDLQIRIEDIFVIPLPRGIDLLQTLQTAADPLVHAGKQIFHVAFIALKRVVFLLSVKQCSSPLFVIPGPPCRSPVRKTALSLNTLLWVSEIPPPVLCLFPVIHNSDLYK